MNSLLFRLSLLSTPNLGKFFSIMHQFALEFHY